MLFKGRQLHILCISCYLHKKPACPTRHRMQRSISTFSASLHISSSSRGLSYHSSRESVGVRPRAKNRNNTLEVMLTQTLVPLQILASGVLCIQQSPIFPPYLRFPGLRDPPAVHYKNFQHDATSQDLRGGPPQPKKRYQYQRPRTDVSQDFNSSPQEIIGEEGGWLANLQNSTGDEISSLDEESAGNRNVEENVLQNSEGRQCMDKVMMVEETEYDEVLTCDHTHDNRLNPKY